MAPWEWALRKGNTSGRAALWSGREHTVGPLVAWAVEWFCCLVLPDLFRERKVSAFGITPMQMGTASAVVNTDHSQMLQAVSVAGRGLAKKSADELISAGYKDTNQEFTTTLALRSAVPKGILPRGVAPQVVARERPDRGDGSGKDTVAIGVV